MAMELQWLWPHLIGGEREGRSTSFSQLWTSCHVPVSPNLQNDPVKGRIPILQMRKLRLSGVSGPGPLASL